MKHSQMDFSHDFLTRTVPCIVEMILFRAQCMLTEFFTAKFSTNFQVALRFFSKFHSLGVDGRDVLPAKRVPRGVFRETALTLHPGTPQGHPVLERRLQLSAGLACCGPGLLRQA